MFRKYAHFYTFFPIFFSFYFACFPTLFFTTGSVYYYLLKRLKTPRFYDEEKVYVCVCVCVCVCCSTLETVCMLALWKLYVSWWHPAVKIVSYPLLETRQRRFEEDRRVLFRFLSFLSIFFFFLFRHLNVGSSVGTLRWRSIERLLFAIYSLDWDACYIFQEELCCRRTARRVSYVWEILPFIENRLKKNLEILTVK